MSLGRLPLGNAIVEGDSAAGELLPVELARCRACGLVQLAQTIPDHALLDQYVYFTSASPSLLDHGTVLAAALVDELALDENSLVVEIGSNDGTLLRNFVERGVNVLGIEVTDASAAAARAIGVETIVAGFDMQLAIDLTSAGRRPDLAISISVLEIVTDPLDLARGIATLLADQGVAVLEVPYIRPMVEGVRFDAISHTTVSWFSLETVQTLLARAGLQVIDANAMPFRGGTLRVMCAPSGRRTPTARIDQIIASERHAGLHGLERYEQLSADIRSARNGLVDFVRDASSKGRRVAAYGAGIKASTLLNVCDLRTPELMFAVDGNPHRHGTTLPGVDLPVVAPERLMSDGVDFAIIAALDFADEVIAQNREFSDRGGQFVVPVPTLRVVGPLFACPRCHGTLGPETDEQFTCPSCGVVGRRTMGIVDFTAGDAVPLASEGSFDLRADERAARRISELGSSLEMLVALTVADDESADFTDRYTRFEEEIANRHGSAMLDKVDAHLAARGLAIAGFARCLEAGGGFGRYLPGFAERFREVVFVDCSLANCLIASRFAEECGVVTTIVRADVQALPFADDAFDLIHQNGVVEHVAQPARMLAESLRVRASGGAYVCLSPNRYPITKEPHYRLRMFGVFPRPLRRRLIARTRGVTTESGTDLLSLRRLRRLLVDARVDAPVFFLPPRLQSIARNTPMRTLAKRALDHPAARRVLLRLVNGPLLPIAPYHLAIVAGPKPG